MIYKMKLWQKIFIISLLTSIILFAFCGVFITVSGHKLNLDYEKDQFESQIQYIAENITDTRPLPTKAQQDNYYFKLLQGNNIIFDFMPVSQKPSRYELSENQPREDIYTEIIEGRHFFRSEINFQYKNLPYTLIISEDISFIFKRCNLQLQTLFSLCLILSIIAALIMLITSKIITMPIVKINEGVNYIKENHYSFRLPVHNEDELNLLCHNFNTMSEAVERNITNYKAAINNFTHEVKTPLTSIIGYTEILKNPSFPQDKQQQAIDYIYLESRRLNSLVHKIISFLTVGTETVDIKPQNIKEITNRAFVSVKAQAEKKDIEIIDVNIDNLTIYGDEELLVVLIVNLLDNAIKASYVGSKIEVFTKSTNSTVTIYVKDFGIGIPKEEIQNITEVFYMVDKARSRQQNGLGLGLAMCAEIIKSHNALLNITSTEDEGTTVSVEFKLGK